MPDLRLGDEIDDYCVKCRRVSNHSIVSLVNSGAAKVRCRSCYSDHDFRNCIAPPTKRELAKQKERFNAEAADAGVEPLAAEPPAETTIPSTKGKKKQN